MDTNVLAKLIERARGQVVTIEFVNFGRDEDGNLVQLTPEEYAWQLDNPCKRPVWPATGSEG